MFYFHFNLKTILCVWVFCLHVCLCATCSQCLRKSEEGILSLELELDSIVISHLGSKNQTQVPLGDQPVFLASEPSLQPVSICK